MTSLSPSDTSLSETSARFSLRRVEKVFLALGLLIAHGFFIHVWLYPSSYDTVMYARSAADIAANGLFSKFVFSDLRPYGYPLFLSGVRVVADGSRIPYQFLLFELQLGFYAAAVFWVRNALVRQYPSAACIGFCGLIGNYYCLLYTAEGLTESLSLTLLLVAAACWLKQWLARELLWPLVVGSLAVGFSMMIRPANVFMVMSWVFACAVIFLRQKPLRWRLVSLRVFMVALFVVLPCLPQLANNIRHHQKVSLLVAVDIWQAQQMWGLEHLKYATAMPPVADIGTDGARVFYENPFFRRGSVDPASPWKWYVYHPLRGFLTLALHTFNMTDQDLLFTYSRDLTPWYRIPLGVLNHGMVALGLLGLVLLGRAACAAPRGRLLEAYTVLVVVLGTNWVLYVPTVVEMRFGLVLLMLAAPLAGYALVRIAASEKSLIRIATAGYALAYVAAALLLSTWVRGNAPSIQAASHSGAALTGHAE